MTSTSVKDLVMANKLKDGVQDAIVYLRMLEGAKLAPVYERKRRHLMEKLLDLQGDTRKEAPPKFDDSDDDDDEDEETSIESPSRRVERDSSSEGDGDKKKRTSKVFDARNRFEKPPQRFQYKTLEQIKLERLAKKEQNQAKETQEKKEDKEQKEEIKKEEIKKEEIEKEEIEKKEVLEKPREDVKELEENEEIDGNGKDEPEPTTPDKKSKSSKSRSHSMGGGFMKKLFKGKERSMSSDTTTSINDSISETSEDKISQNIEVEEEDEKEDEKEEEEEQKPFSTVLDRVTRKLGRYSYQQVVMTLLGESVKVCKPRDKDKGLDISLIGAAAVDKDSYQFELHTAQKSYTFRTDSEELCIKWVNALKEAIEVCNPVVEPIEEEIEEEAPNSPAIPQIVVPEEEEKPKSNIRESVSYENFVPGKKKKEMPDPSTAQVKGYMYKKGKFGWDKCWVLLSNDNVVYIAPNESSKRIQSLIPITVETKVDRKKGSDKFPHAVQITSGKTKDTFATDSLPDYSMWIYCLENACGCADIQELLSEDEDADAGELYEELGIEEPQRAPFIPSSPRPSNSPFHTPSSAIPDDDIYEGAIDDDIYEGLDEIDIPKEMKTPNPPPALPSAPPPKFQPPSLPPRNVPLVQAPVLPPRPTKNTTPLDYEAPTPSPPSARKQTPAPIDEDVYDDVVVSDKQEQDLEETYDDIVSVTQPPKKQVSSGDLYEDMIPDSSYVQMERHNEIDEEYTEMTLSGNTEPIDEDVYDDVDVVPPRPPPPSSSPGKILSPVHNTTPVRSSSPGAINSPIRQSSIPTTVSNMKNIPPKSSTLPKMSSSGAGRIPSPLAPKKLSTSGKVATLSKMFGTQPGESSPPSQIKKDNKKRNHSGTLLYKSPGKQAFSSEWCVLDGSTLIFYNGPNDKLSHYRLNLRDVVLMSGSPDGKGSVFAFHIIKGTYTHQFSVSSKEELTEWIGVLVSVVQKVSPNEEDLYRAVQDHEGTKEGEVSFQKDAFIWVLGKDTSALWTGVVGTSPESFTNASGVLPANKVKPFIPEENVYF